ncbi:GDPGTP exchange factor Sec2p [Penicillium italicum]|uniref:GDPGTP exchange factor Sec2p n=1 Tax=Penicillium italicum TaxID=40296 RepID=A0A0A2L7M9_PENIT|nr:GDPGTP exchange factor Sec2p [Penicillium italicum]
MKGVTISEKQCPMCWGEGFPQDGSGAHDRIHELEGQVHALTARASATATKLSEYEDEIRRLRASQPQGSYHTPRSSSSLGRPPSRADHSSPQRPTSSESQPQPQPQTYQSRLTNLASFLPYRRSSATTTTSSGAGLPSTPTALTTPPTHMSPANSEHTAELQNALTREQRLRKAAESQLSQASTELEELTVQLFSQANEMVAEERKARAKLEERVAVLEQRDVEKRSRLEKLEKAVARVERLRALVNHDINDASQVGSKAG